MLSLRTKILAIAATLVLLSQGGTVFAVLLSAGKDVGVRASQSLETGMVVLRKAASSRARDFETTVAAIAADYGLKQAVGLGDLPTIESALLNHALRADADLAILVDNDARLLAVSGAATGLFGNGGDYADFADPVGRRTLTIQGRGFEIFTVPVRAPRPIAWMTMGYELTDDYAAQLHDLINLDVSIVGPDRRVLASSADAGFTRALPESDSITHVLDEPAPVVINNIDYLALAAPLHADDQQVMILLSKSLAEAMAPYDLLKTASFALGAIPLLIALLGAVLLSRAITRPVKVLMDAATRIRAGDYGTPVVISSGDELSQFGVTFNAMQEEIASREKQIRYQATHDLVTDLHNAQWMFEHVETQIAQACDGDTFVLMLVSLNARDDIAGTLGHQVEEAYLHKAARDLRRFIDSSFMVARLEQDTFAIFFAEKSSMQASYVARDLSDRLRSGVRLPVVNMSVDPAIGVAVFPTHARTAEQLIQRATIARREAMADGRPIRFYRDGDEENLIRNMTLLQGIDAAADQDQFRMYCQPKIRLATETVCGVEALIRWDHPQYGWLMPDQFIPLIEHSGNVSVLTRWILERAAYQQKQWQAQGLDLTIAVNISARDLLDRELPWFVMDLIKQRDLAPDKLVIEITEEAMVRDFDYAVGVLERLRGLGMQLAIDDFGTGYSSLEQLKHLPVSQLKIDKSFVANIPEDPADTAIVSAIVEMAERLDLEVVAEGVETGAAMAWLRAHGIAQAQGFYWSKPIAAADLAEWVDNFSGGSTQQVRKLEIS